jgi:hypothetical protein
MLDSYENPARELIVSDRPRKGLSALSGLIGGEEGA